MTNGTKEENDNMANTQRTPGPWKTSAEFEAAYDNARKTLQAVDVGDILIAALDQRASIIRAALARAAIAKAVQS